MALSKLPATALAAGAAKANIGAGAVLQVASGSTSASVVNNTSTWVGTGLSVTLTPQNTSSRILLLVNLPFQHGSNNYVYDEFRIIRNGSTQVYYTKCGNSVSAYVVNLDIYHMSYIDSPVTSAAVTYTVEFRIATSSGEYGSEIFNPGATSNVPQIIAMEIAG